MLTTFLTKERSPAGNVALASAVLFGVWLLLNVFTITPAGQTKVQVCFGSINESKTYDEGIHFPVNPFCSFDTFDTRESRFEIEGLTIPTQDRFSSKANVTVLYRIEPSAAIRIRKDYGDQERFIDTTLRQQLRSIVRNEGRELKDSRSLAQANHISQMQYNVTTYLQDKLNANGLVINEALIQDIEFDPGIRKQIMDTQERIQKEESELSQERIANTQAKQVIAKAHGDSEAKKKQTDAVTYQIRENAEAEAAAVKAAADAERYRLEEIAKGNTKLSASLTPSLLRHQELLNEAILYERSKGLVPDTVINGDLRAYGIAVKHDHATK